MDGSPFDFAIVILPFARCGGRLTESPPGFSEAPAPIVGDNLSIGSRFRGLPARNQAASPEIP
jgi:hypothetical protein